MRKKRYILKLSGEVLQGNNKFGISDETLTAFAKQLIKINDLGYEVGIVIGGGNFFRGSSKMASKMRRAAADNIGMLVTIQNSIALFEKLKQLKSYPAMFTSRNFANIGCVFQADLVHEAFQKGKITIFSGGTGSPFFTTDTSAVLRALEVDAAMVLKGTKVDGIYDKDPVENNDAIFLKEISYQEYIKLNLKVMDLTAITLAWEYNLPIKIFNTKKYDNIQKAFLDKDFGSLIH